MTVTILLLIHRKPTAAAFTKLYIYLYEVKRLSNMPKDLIIIYYLCRQYYETIYKPVTAKGTGPQDRTGPESTWT